MEIFLFENFQEKMREKKSIPKSKTGRWVRTHKYPYKDLEVTDCFFVDDVKRGNSAASAARNWGKKNNRTFKSSAEDGGIYIWRIK